MDALEVVAELEPLVRGFCPGPCAIALGGSHAKGGGDGRSDVDIYLFADRVLGGARRTELVTAGLGAESEALSWGRDEPFEQGGTDFVHRGLRVECWLRSTRMVESILADCRAGRITREYVPWTVMGFFNYALLGDLESMRIVRDTEGTLARWKAEVDPYPERLRIAIVHRFLGEAAFWPGNPHYAAAVERGDALYAAGIVQQVVHALLQVVFAMNRRYFPGEKRLAERLAELPLLPEAFADRVHALLFPGGGDVAHLREQQRELGALVEEVRRLAGRRRPAEKE